MVLSRILVVPVLLSIYGCSLEVTVHDEDRAADLAKQHLAQIISGSDTREVYDNAHDKFKENLDFNEFDAFVTRIRSQIPNRPLEIVGYETFGAKQAIIVYAQSLSESTSVFFKLSYIGTKSKDYKLLGFHINGSDYKKSGLYRDYRAPLRVGDV